MSDDACAKSGTDMVCGARTATSRSSSPASRCQPLLRTGYAKSGTDIGHGATSRSRRRLHVTMSSSSFSGLLSFLLTPCIPDIQHASHFAWCQCHRFAIPGTHFVYGATSLEVPFCAEVSRNANRHSVKVPKPSCAVKLSVRATEKCRFCVSFRGAASRLIGEWCRGCAALTYGVVRMLLGAVQKHARRVVDRASQRHVCPDAWSDPPLPGHVSQPFFVPVCLGLTRLISALAGTEMGCDLRPGAPKIDPPPRMQVFESTHPYPSNDSQSGERASPG